ncbi:MAG: peptide ABC transporter substrate-binding protein [Chloroflexota bacterium]|nr:peptide ABC transporter substrate-binding protein [Chloroflexota bacterium]
MSEKPDLKAQLEMMKERLEAAGMNRRDVLKVAAAATGAAAVTGAINYGSAAASPLTGRRRLRYAKPQDAEEQVFYHTGVYEDPTSFDWNLNLYCNAEEETFAGLLTFDENLVAVPDWAESFESNEDATVWTFRIRPDNQGWTDGTPVTAGDFVYSWGRQLNPANAAAYAGFLIDIKGANAFNNSRAYGADADGNPLAEEAEDDPLFGKMLEESDLGIVAIDDWTLEVTMQGPRAYFPQVVAYQAAVPAPRWKVEELGDEWALNNNGEPIVSNGPFKVDAWNKGQSLEMSKHEGYWDAENIALDRVIEPISPSTNEVLLFEQGEGDQKVDWAVLPAGDYERYMADPELAQLVSPYVYYGIWMLNPQVTVAPFDNPAVRKALSHAVDRDRLATVTQGLVTPGYCMVPQGVYGFLDDPALAEIQKFDPQMAMDALVGTEFEGGQNWPEITMWMRANEELYNANIMAEDIVAQLKDNLGMDVQIQQVPQSNFSEQLFENTWQLIFIRWWYDYPDPNNGYGDMFYSRKASGKRQAYSSDAFDDLVEQGKAEPDPEKRLEIYRQAEEIIQTDVGYMPLVYRVDNYVFKPWVKGVAVNNFGQAVPDGNIYVRMLTKVSIEGREN